MNTFTKLIIGLASVLALSLSAAKADGLKMAPFNLEEWASGYQMVDPALIVNSIDNYNSLMMRGEGQGTVVRYEPYTQAIQEPAESTTVVQIIDDVFAGDFKPEILGLNNNQIWTNGAAQTDQVGTVYLRGEGQGHVVSPLQYRTLDGILATL